MEIRIRANPHPAQAQIHNSSARFKVIDAGRRFGKTRLGVLECFDTALAGGRAWWIAPIYKIAEIGWRPLMRMGMQIPLARVSKSEMRVEFRNGGEVAVRSADNPQNLRGEGLDLLVLDEAAYIKKGAWVEVLRPALSDKKGRAIFISTPRGRNWFYELWQMGNTGQPDYASFKFPTSANPYIDPAEIEDARRQMPELMFRQEYLAEFIDDSGGVFRKVQSAVYYDDYGEPKKDHTYCAGVDVAAMVDYTVISILDINDRVVAHIDRFNRVDYPVLVDRIMEHVKRWKLNVVKVEENGIGRPVIDMLYQLGAPVMPFLTTNATKQMIIQNLQAAFEHEDIGIPNDPVLIAELLSFESKRNPSGSFTYSAPEDMHDDCVMSLAITWDTIANSGNVTIEENPFYP